jgi:lipocalin
MLLNKLQDSAWNSDMKVSFHNGRFKVNTTLYVLSTESVVKWAIVQSSNHTALHTVGLKKSVFLGYQNS